MGLASVGREKTPEKKDCRPCGGRLLEDEQREKLHAESCSIGRKGALADPAKRKLFQATCRDLEQLRKCFKEDHLMVLVVSIGKEGFNAEGHKYIFDDLYYETMVVGETLADSTEKQ
ncbi:hypothetical protein PR048_031927 [Dryococelus australis]|uniref:Uncharacterized protein n=1 Tax=Dryococelus australis TaxID=614101 RepID=A0ABQ9G6P1_9NEOP|nr:hypothetical protein PR048_031927 [Dryococelus australis]